MLLNICIINDCSGNTHARQMCNRHYIQWRLHGVVTGGNDRRKAIIEGDEAKLPLGKNGCKGFALIDKESAYVDVYYWTEHHGYVEGLVNGKYTSLHRLITGAPKDMQVDHKNLNTLDNRKTNLRVCTKLENSRNSGKHRNNTTGYRGVIASYGKYAAKLGYMGKKLHLGYFNTPEEAARAYDAKALALHGKFAKLNFNEGTK